MKCAVRDGEESENPNLASIGYQIVKKCGGVPLAKMALRGLLYSKRDEPSWVLLRNELGSTYIRKIVVYLRCICLTMHCHLT